MSERLANMQVAMSFAAAAYDSRGSDIVIGADRRWCHIMEDGTLIPCDENAAKCFRLRDDIGLAFSGLSNRLLMILAGLHEDDSLRSAPISEIEGITENRSVRRSLDYAAIVALLNEMMPDLLQEIPGVNPIQDGFGVFLAGRDSQSGRPLVTHWSKDTDWASEGFPYPCSPMCIRPPETLDPEVWRIYKPGVDAKLNAPGLPPAIRIRNVISSLGRDERIVSVNAQALIRSLRNHFQKTDL